MARKRFADLQEKKDYAYRMAKIGMPHDKIAFVLGYPCKNDLYAAFKEELEDGKADGAEKVLTTLFDMASSGDPKTQASLIFWCKTQLGFRDVASVEISGEGGGPVRIIQSEPMTQDEWEKYYGDKSGDGEG